MQPVFLKDYGASLRDGTAGPGTQRAFCCNSNALVIGCCQDPVDGSLVQAMLVNCVLFLALHRSHYSLANHFCIGDFSRAIETHLFARFE